MIKKEVLKFHDASDNDLEYSIENVHHIIHLFKKRDFLVEYSCEDSLLKITTPFGKWKMLTDRRPIRILHINLYHDLGIVEPELFKSQNLAVIGHVYDLLMLYSRSRV